MKKITLLLACLLLTSYSFGQMKVKWGPVYKNEGAFTKFYLAGGDVNNYYLLMRPKKDNTLLKFNYNHNLVGETPITFEYNGDNLMLKEFIHTKTKTFGVFTDYDKKLNAFTIQAAEFSGGKFSPIKEIARQPYLIQYKYFYYFALGKTDNDETGGFSVSADSSYVATIQTLSSKEKSQADQISVIVFDENMQVKWQKIQDFPYKDKKLDIHDFVVSNNGDVYIAATLDIDRKNKGVGMPDYSCKIFRITNDKFQDFSIELKGRNVASSIGLFVSSNNEDVYFGGFSMDRDNGTKGDNGTFFGKLNVTSEKITATAHPFSKAFLDGLVGEIGIDKGNGVKRFIIKDFVSFPDGSFSFVAEKYFEFTTSSSSANATNTVTTYYTNEIIVPRFEENGVLRNIVKIDKEYRNTKPMYTSYCLASYNNKLFLLYNDTKTKGEITTNGSKPTYSALNLISDLAIIGADGQIESTKTLFANNESNGDYSPKFSRQFGDKLIICNFKGAEYQYGTLILK